MIRKLKKICKHPNCNNLTDNSNGYCDKHKSNARSKYIYDSFYKTKDWIEVSKQYRRMNPICEYCHQEKARIVHHNPSLIYLIQNDLNPYDWEYLFSICWSCHEKEHKRRKK